MKSLKELLNFGILNIDKPSNPTSFYVSDFIRRKLSKFGIKKTSHFGTLDPKVTGVLPIALGRACKLTGFFIGHDKTYVGILKTHKEQNTKELQKIINNKFTGKIKQTPPVKSRVKRQERIREVKKWILLEQDEQKKNFVFIAQVEGGTYIRKLCSDLGDLIGGAHMAELRRINAGIFSEKDKEFCNLYEFESALNEEKELRKIILPAEEAIKKILPIIQAEPSQKKHLLTGKPIIEEYILEKDLEKLNSLKEGEKFAIFNKEEFIEIAHKSNENQIIARPEFVYN